MLISQVLILIAFLAYFVICQENKSSQVATSVKWVPIEDIKSKSLKPLKNSHGMNIYIGRTTYKGSTIPGVVFYAMSEIYFTFEKELHSKPEFELLVDPRDELKWVPVSGKIINPVIAGHNPKDCGTLFVCRVVEKGNSFMIGKVSSALENCTLTSDGRTVQHFAEYEVLVWAHTSQTRNLPTCEVENKLEKFLSQYLNRPFIFIGVNVAISAVLTLAGIVAWAYRRKRLQGSHSAVSVTEEDSWGEYPIKK